MPVDGRPAHRPGAGRIGHEFPEHLSYPEERDAALCLYRALLAARELVATGAKDRENILATVRQMINAAPGARIDYVALVDPATLQDVEAIQGEARLLLAVWVNKALASLTIPCLRRADYVACNDEIQNPSGHRHPGRPEL